SVDAGHAAAVLAFAGGRALPETEQASTAGRSGAAGLSKRTAGRLTETVVACARAAARVLAAQGAAARRARIAALTGQATGLDDLTGAVAFDLAGQRRIAGLRQTGETVAAGRATAPASISLGRAAIHDRKLGPLGDVVGGREILEGEDEGGIAAILIGCRHIRIHGRHPQQGAAIGGLVIARGRRTAQSEVAVGGEGEPVESGLGAVVPAHVEGAPLRVAVGELGVPAVGGAGGIGALELHPGGVGDQAGRPQGRRGIAVGVAVGAVAAAGAGRLVVDEEGAIRRDGRVV